MNFNIFLLNCFFSWSWRIECNESQRKWSCCHRWYSLMHLLVLFWLYRLRWCKLMNDVARASHPADRIIRLRLENVWSDAVIRIRAVVAHSQVLFIYKYHFLNFWIFNFFLLLYSIGVWFANRHYRCTPFYWFMLFYWCLF